jgi:hypothetical protein
LLALAASALAAKDAWKTKPPKEWTQEDVLELLNDSPWAKEVDVYHLSGRILGVLPGGRKVVYQDDPNLPSRRYSIEPVTLEPERLRGVYGVRWSSAEIVQQGLARLQELSPVLAEMQAPPPELSSQHVVLTVRVIHPPTEGAERLLRPTVLDTGGRPLPDEPGTAPDLFDGLEEEELRAAAELRLAGGRRIEPERVARHGLGTSAGVSFFFPRQQKGQATLERESDQAEFVFEGKKGNALKAKFKLSKMRFGNRSDY